MKKSTILIAVAAVVLLFVGFRFSKHPVAEAADKILINGKILTADSSNSIAQAVAIKDGKILAVGTSNEINRYKGNATVVVDLKGSTVTPGFIDGHSHFMSWGRQSAVDISAPPVGTVKSIPDIVTLIKKFKEEKKIPPGEWIAAFGYDQDQLAEKRHPTKEDLDAAFPDNPVTLTHVSGHMTLVNSAALKASAIDANTPDPPGGVIVRKNNSKEPTGLLQERASGLLKRPQRPQPTLEERLAQLKKQQEFYASNGITTAQDGSTGYESLELLQEAAKRNELIIDIEALASYQSIDKVLANPSFKFNQLQNHFKIAGFKLVSDGSPQGKTAYFTRSYLTEVPGCSNEHCTGVPTVTQQQFNEAITKGFKNDIRTFVHCNGDASIDMYIRAIKYADSALNTTSNNRRPVVIHSQFVRPDQLDAYKQLGMIPALFSNHAFFWGDVHVRNLGKDRAFFLSPLKTAAKKGIVATDHTDWGVTPLNQLFLLWTAVERKSRSGEVIGPDERLTPLEALRTITINGAYQYVEEKLKGSIQKGKLADLVILSDDITTIDPGKIKDVVVLETIKEGKTIYKK